MSSKAMAFAIISAAAATSSSSIVSAFHYSALSPMSSANAATSSHRSFQLDASSGNNNFSELDKLRAKRLSLKRPSPSQAAATSGPIKDASSDTQQRGLEYLYDQTQERHDDDFFHVILMPS